MKEFKTKSSITNNYLTLGIVGLILGIIVTFIVGNPILLLASVMMMINGIFHKNTALVKIFENHIEMKTAPVSALILVKFEDIKEVKLKSEKNATMHVIVKGKEKKLRLPLNTLSKEDREELTDTLTIISQNNKATA